MRKFDLVSVDWDSVRLMQAGQFKQETFYLEELVRWTLQRGRIAGLLPPLPEVMVAVQQLQLVRCSA